MKNLDNIWQEYINQDFLNEQTLKDLIWHIENDQTSESVVMATDMIVETPNNAQLKKLIPHIAKQLEHEDEYVRELAVGSIVGRIKLPEYAEKALNMAKNDPCQNVRSLASKSLGAVINNVNPFLQKQIAIYLYNVMTSVVYDNLFKQATYRSILEAMEVPIDMWPPIKRNPDILNIVDRALLKKFKGRYNIRDSA